MNVLSRGDAKHRGLIRYFTGKPCKYGHVSERYVLSCRCVRCCKESEEKRDKHATAKRKKQYNIDNAERLKEYRLNNRERRREYDLNNKNSIKERRRKWLEENKERVAKYSREYDLDNKEHLNECRRKREVDNPLSRFTRNSLYRIERATGARRIHRAELELGYTQDEFKCHIESMFEEGMSWSNRSEWHIDHIIPLSWWLNEGITDVSLINSLINLQPLWAYDNLSKGVKLL